MSEESKIESGDCLDLMGDLERESIDLIYLDPPFFTNKKHTLKTRDRQKEFSFSDLWKNHEHYANFMSERLIECHRILKDTGSLFLHCDKSASHILKLILDGIFGEDNFQAEIIWTYRRWSNSAKGLLPSHQTILFYSKSQSYTFNTIYTDYSETTNVDQILQKRGRDEHKKSTYARTDSGDVITSLPKKGVPLSDVWEIPFLNPKAKERAGYPTQKPLILLERIIALASNPGETILDPFCGSGTTLVAARLLGRKSIGFDSSEEAIALTQERLSKPIKTESALLKKGRSAYMNADKEAIAMLGGIDVIPIHRNSGIDAILKTQYEGQPVPIRVQRMHESISDAAKSLYNASLKRGSKKAFLIQTHECYESKQGIPNIINIIDSPSYRIKKSIN